MPRTSCETLRTLFTGQYADEELPIMRSLSMRCGPMKQQLVLWGGLLGLFSGPPFAYLTYRAYYVAMAASLCALLTLAMLHRQKP